MQDTQHPDYISALPQWELMDDVLKGEDAVKDAGETYLPTFDEDTGEQAEDYKRYKERADFFEITGRARTAMVGFLFRKDPRLKAPGHEQGDKTEGEKNDSLEKFLADATLTQKSFYDVAKSTSNAVIGFGRCGTLIDWSKDENQPFIVYYDAADVINWRYERIAGRMVLTMLMLHELDPTVYAIENNKPVLQPQDPYETVLFDQWRELRLVKKGDVYQVESIIWRKRETGTGEGRKPEFYQVGSTATPMRKAQPLNEIPFVFHTTEGPYGVIVPIPPLLGMARKNLSLYRTSADLENARHVLGMPTPWAAGFGDTGSTKLYLGSTVAWTTTEPNARAGFLALQGGDLQPLTDAVKEKQQEMAQLGARMLDAEAAFNRAPEAFATVALRQTGETAALTQISLSLTQSLTDVLAWALWWSSNAATLADAGELVEYTLNTDFVGTIIDASTLNALMATYLQKGMSFESLFAKLQAADLIPADRSVEQEKDLIAAGESTLTGITTPRGRPQQGQQQAAAGNEGGARQKEKPIQKA